MSTQQSVTPPLALIVEANEAAAIRAADAVRSSARMRFRSETVARLDAALKRLERGDVDVVLLGLHLPDADGLAGLTRIFQVTRDVPIVILTSLDDDQLALAAVQAGAQEYLVKGTTDPRTVGRTLRHAIERHRLLADLGRSLEGEGRPTFDRLTGLPNRALFFDRLAHTVERAARYGERCAVVLLDLDQFERINEACGHSAGDQVLVQVAARLGAAIRRSDTIARVAGDEFALLLERLPSRERAEVLATEAARMAGGTVDVSERRLDLDVTWGHACYPEDGRDADTLVRVADAAMYRTKLSRR